MTFFGEHRDIIPHRHKPQIDQLPEMIRIDSSVRFALMSRSVQTRSMDRRGSTPDMSPRLSFII
jgi:hypothetical protein